MDKPILVVMCGLQASGKSTETQNIALKIYDKLGTSTDIIASDIFRNAHPDWNNETVFNRLYRIMNQSLKENNNVIIDATNITNKSRRQIFANLKVDCYKVCYIMNTPYNVCLNRLINRNAELYCMHYVPEEALKKYYYSFEIPFYEEGWDKIVLHNIVSHTNSDDYIADVTNQANGYHQMNKHHTQDLGSHLKTVGDLLKDNEILNKAGYLHDIGKLFTRTFKEGDPNAHYYNHANVGAYNLMCNYAEWDESNPYESLYELNKTLEILFYVNYHMNMFNLKTEKSINKWKKIFGEEKFNNLIKFNEADKYRGESKMKKKIYFAADLFSEGTRMYNDVIINKLEELGFDVYAPQRNMSINDKSKCANSIDIYNGDTQELKNADILVALLDGVTIDPGVAAEIGLVAGWNEICEPNKKKTIIGLYTDSREGSVTHSIAKDEMLADEIAENQYSYINLYVIGCIKMFGKVVGSKEELFNELSNLLK